METIVDLVSEGATRFDRRPALLIRPFFRTRLWRYRDLGKIVPRAARVLEGLGIGPGDRVVVWAVNRPEWGIGFFAVAHRGAVSVPLDVRHTLDFAAKIAAQTEAKLVLASRQTDEVARQLGLPVLWVETLVDQARRAEPVAAAGVRPDDLAEIVFTSGTTGEPKGAMLSHRNLMFSANSMTQVVQFGTKDRLLSVLPLSHLYEQVLGFMAPLSVGASIVYPVSRQPSVLIRTFRDFKVSMLLIVPQGLRLLNSAVERRVDQTGQRARFEMLHRIARRLPRPFRRLLFRPVLSQFGGRLHTIGCGASSLDADVAERWTDMGVQILQGYGATEMGPVVTFTRPERNVMSTVGEPIPGAEVRIAPDGEILARSPGRFLGYWKNPDATAACIDADGWYHMGDLGQLRPDGMLVFRGRKKDMLALPDGQKVYAEDVEREVRADPRVKEVAVVGWPLGAGLKVHAVLLLADPGASPDAAQDAAEAIVTAANARLAPHQQIRGFTVWPDDDLPRTATLKVRKPVILERLADLERPATARVPAVASKLRAAPLDHDVDPITVIVAGLAERDPAAVTPSMRLSSDLDLDSLQRVELLGIIEEETGVFVDDELLQPDTTVGELVAIVEKERGATRAVGAWRWPLSPVVRAIGLAIQVLLIYPFVHLFYRVTVRGLENLHPEDGPFLLTPNHGLHLDNGVILTRLPLAVRWKLAVAAGAETIYENPVKGVLASVLANAFPLQREGGIRKSLELLGSRMDAGYSILIYPEGKLTNGGPMQPFKSGAGLIAVEGGSAVVPARLKVLRMSIIDRRRLPAALRGEVELVIGEPIWFDSTMDHATATTQLEAAVAAL
jgi:long-chain acyl-CoA synthetase